ncbi:hypothetical protein KI387_009697, partial [Taxus chinensis]
GQYVQWAREAGVDVGSSNDSFFYDPTIRDYYKNYVKLTGMVIVSLAWYWDTVWVRSMHLVE